MVTLTPKVSATVLFCAVALMAIPVLVKRMKANKAKVETTPKEKASNLVDEIVMLPTAKFSPEIILVMDLTLKPHIERALPRKIKEIPKVKTSPISIASDCFPCTARAISGWIRKPAQKKISAIIGTKTKGSMLNNFVKEYVMKLPSINHSPTAKSIISITPKQRENPTAIVMRMPPIKIPLTKDSAKSTMLVTS